MTEAWRTVFRDGFLKTFSMKHLEAMREGLKGDDPRIIQGATTDPPPLMVTADWPVIAADLIGYAGWQGDGLGTVGAVEEFFARTCFQVNQLLGEPAACRWWLNWSDDEPRSKMFREALEEVEREICLRLHKEIRPDDGPVEIRNTKIDDAVASWEYK